MSGMADELGKAREALANAEREAKFKPEIAQAYVSIANGFLRIEEIKTQKAFIQVLKEELIDFLGELEGPDDE